ncbi:MAG TPA: hypothetical protein DCS97_02720 [Planctomycetes bacterium]|nr:hypothetical protein [Planctomycetota bacterium]
MALIPGHGREIGWNRPGFWEEGADALVTRRRFRVIFDKDDPMYPLALEAARDLDGMADDGA